MIPVVFIMVQLPCPNRCPSTNDSSRKLLDFPVAGPWAVALGGRKIQGPTDMVVGLLVH